MDIIRGHLLLLTMIAVKAFEDFEGYLQRPLSSSELLDILNRGLLTRSDTVIKEGPNVKPNPMNPSIPFPLAYPTTDNLHAICHYSNLRLRYAKAMRPRDGYDYLQRQATAVNQLESWFSGCCSNGTQDEAITLCCAQQAWEKSLTNFCDEEFSIKTSHYHCCRNNGKERWDCFKEEAPDPLYKASSDGDAVPSPIQDFNFKPSICTKSSISEPTARTETAHEPTDPQISQGRPEMPSIPFPLARPNSTNIFAICQYSSQRLRTSKEMLSLRSNYGYLQPRADSVNQLELWYTVCCANGTQVDELTLCCAQQAWEKSLSDFCGGEFEVESHDNRCCRMYGRNRWNCFEKMALYRSYQPSGLPGFDFDPTRCQMNSISDRSITLQYIDFPPGRPNSNNIRGICLFHKDRPRYVTDCLPRTGYEWFVHRLKTVNGIEKSFRHCCKKKQDELGCFEEKWRKMVDRFCNDEKRFQVNPFECCRKRRGQEQYDCFSATAPNPDYMIPPKMRELEPDLFMFCSAYTDIQKTNLFPVGELAERCCSLKLEEESECLRRQLDNIMDEACRTNDPSLSQIRQHCCKKAVQRRSKCITNMLLNKIAKAKKYGYRRICPAYS